MQPPPPYIRIPLQRAPFKKGERVIALEEISDSEKAYAQQGDLGVVVHLDTIAQTPIVKFDGHLTSIAVGLGEIAPAPN